MTRLAAALVLAVSTFVATAADHPKPTGADFARTFPYSMAGQLLFESGDDYFSGSGTVIRASSVLTAGHNLYDFNGGWSTDLLFRRGLYGDDALSEQTARRIYVLGGYRENVTRYGAEDLRAFARDIGGLCFAKPVANGAYAGWSTDRALLTGTSYNIALGYGGEGRHTGDDLLWLVPKRPFFQVYGGFFENDSIYVESGMSGGPVFAEDANGDLYVCALIVSGSSDPAAAGVRIFNSTVANFIRRYLR